MKSTTRTSGKRLSTEVSRQAPTGGASRGRNFGWIVYHVQRPKRIFLRKPAAITENRCRPQFRLGLRKKKTRPIAAQWPCPFVRNPRKYPSSK